MASRIDNILIVGGGTSGWLTAAFLARQLGASQPGGVKITLIESEAIGTIGVGEGTLTSLRLTMSMIGVDEAEFMRACLATFKQGIHFVDWERAPENGQHSRYFHPFNIPRPMGGGIDLAPYWQLGNYHREIPFSDAVTTQDKVYLAGKAPKRLSDAPYTGPMNYAYHLDAAKLGEYLTKVGKALGVTHLIGNVDQVNLDEDGAIRSLSTKEHGELTAGLYIDCTGFAGALIGKALGSPFRNVNHQLFVDRAIAIQVPYDRPDAPIPCATITTAHPTGWTWDIGLYNRRGTGYLYSSGHTEDNDAEAALRRYIGPDAKELSARRLRMRIGYREDQWVKNCIAIGLSGGFLEPLESTGILFVEAAIHMLADYFPRDGNMRAAAKFFNRAMRQRYETAIDFIKLHFYLSKREDSDFWLDNRRHETVPDSLLDKLDLWKYRTPGLYDEMSVHDTFKIFGYQYIMYGMGLLPDYSGNPTAYPYMDQAAKEFKSIQDASRRAVAALPLHRELIEQVYSKGFEKKDAGPIRATPLGR